MIENGSPVSRGELAAYIKGIDESFRVIREDISDIKDTLGMRSKAWTGAAPFFLIALLSSAVTVGVSLFVR